MIIVLTYIPVMVVAIQKPLQYVVTLICPFDVCLLSIALIFDLGITESMTDLRGFQAYVSSKLLLQ